MIKRMLLAAVTALVCAAPLAQAHVPSEEEWTRNIEQWQARMKTMHEQMAKIADAQDPQERQRLLAEHWQLMGEQMDEMNMMGGSMMRQGMMGHGSMGPGMMGHGMMGPGTMGHGMMGHHGSMGPGMMGAMCGCPMCGMMQMMQHHMKTMHGDSAQQQMHKGMRGGMHDDMMHHE